MCSTHLKVSKRYSWEGSLTEFERPGCNFVGVTKRLCFPHLHFSFDCKITLICTHIQHGLLFSEYFREGPDMSTIPLRNNTFHQYFLQKTVISKAGHRSFNSRPVISEAKRRPAPGWVPTSTTNLGKKGISTSVTNQMKRSGFYPPTINLS